MRNELELFLILPAVIAFTLCVAMLCGCVLMVANTWREVRPKRKKRHEVVTAELVEQSQGCPDAGDKFCEMRGCAIIGECQHPTRNNARRIAHTP